MEKNIFPDFLIVGAAKSGTTALHEYLKSHPDIFLPQTIKETFFFTGKKFKNINRKGGLYGQSNVTTYQQYTDLFLQADKEQVMGEACVGYLYYYNETIKNIKKYLPEEPKIIIILRNPVDRAFSNYSHHLRDGYEKKEFREAIQLSQKRINDNWWWGYDLLGAGLYYKQVKAFLDNFKYVKIILFDDFKENPLGILSEICSFLGVRTDFEFNTEKKYNVSGIPKNPLLYRLINRPFYAKKIIRQLIPEKILKLFKNRFGSNDQIKRISLSKEDKKFLREYYRADIMKLQKLILRDLSNWLK